MAQADRRHSPALAVYAPLTFFPPWIVRGELDRQRGLARGLVAVEVFVMAFTTLGKGG